MDNKDNGVMLMAVKDVTKLVKGRQVRVVELDPSAKCLQQFLTDSEEDRHRSLQNQEQIDLEVATYKGMLAAHRKAVGGTYTLTGDKGTMTYGIIVNDVLIYLHASNLEVVN